MKQVIKPGLLSGDIRIPASKSDSQRAILCAALAEGKSLLSGIGRSDDERAMLNAIEAFGAAVSWISDSEIAVVGVDHLPDEVHLSAGESGLGLRLLTCVAASFDQKVTLNGRGSLLSRPMHFFDEVLPQFGCRISTTTGFLPIEVQGPLQGKEVAVDGSLSSQFISGLLLALPRSKESSSLTVVDMKSGPYIQMTISTLRHFGIVIEHERNRFKIAGNQSYKATQYQVEADWSSASYWLVAAAIGHPVSISGLKMSSLQADKAMLGALMSAGCKVTFEGQTIQVDGSGIRPFEFDATDCPDLFPALVVLAAKCIGISKLKGTKRLLHKESNRALALYKEFEKMGVKIELEDDWMIVYGTGKLVGAEVHSHEDHRIAMCLGIAGSIAEGETILTNSNAVSKSYPDFWGHFNALQSKSAV